MQIKVSVCNYEAGVLAVTCPPAVTVKTLSQHLSRVGVALQWVVPSTACALISTISTLHSTALPVRSTCEIFYTSVSSVYYWVCVCLHEVWWKFSCNCPSSHPTVSDRPSTWQSAELHGIKTLTTKWFQHRYKDRFKVFHRLLWGWHQHSLIFLCTALSMYKLTIFLAGLLALPVSTEWFIELDSVFACTMNTEPKENVPSFIEGQDIDESEVQTSKRVKTFTEKGLLWHIAEKRKFLRSAVGTWCRHANKIETLLTDTSDTALLKKERDSLEVEMNIVSNAYEYLNELLTVDIESQDFVKFENTQSDHYSLVRKISEVLREIDSQKAWSQQSHTNLHIVKNRVGFIRLVQMFKRRLNMPLKLLV